MTLFEVLSESKTLEIMLSLRTESKHVRRLQHDIGGSLTTIVDRVNSLMKEGLIEEQCPDNASKIVTLTSRGKVIANFLQSMENNKVNGSFSDLLKGPSKWILILLYYLQKVKGSTRLEKMLFLLNEKYNKIEKDFYKFVPQTFGPYSEKALDDAKTLSELGLIDIKKEPFESWGPGDIIIRSDYNLTETGREEAEKLVTKLAKDDDFKEIVQDLQKLNRWPLTPLLEYVHKEWPQYCCGEDNETN